MKRAVQNVEELLFIFSGQIYAACRMGAWCFNEEKYLFFSTAPHQEEYHMFLYSGGCLQLAIDRKDEPGIPYIMNGKLGLAWIAEWIHTQGDDQFLIVLGPVYLKNTPVEHSLQRLDGQGVSQYMRRQYLNVLSDVPVLGFDMLCQYACILHYTCYQENINPVSLQVEPRVIEREKGELDSRLDKNDYQRMAGYEEMLLHHLAEGMEPEKGRNNYEGELQDFGLDDSLRQIKNNLVIFTGLCARTAVKSGVPLYTARTMENEWVHRIEALCGFPAAEKLCRNMYDAFLDQIRQQREHVGQSRAVRECRNYIQLNYMKELTLEEIAGHCGYAEYYLSRKFAKETGIKLNEYIHQVRIDAAKIMLLTTSKEVQEISDELHFGNRNHFDRVFRQRVGVSPARFRDQIGQIEESK